MASLAIPRLRANNITMGRRPKEQPPIEPEPTPEPISPIRRRRRAEAAAASVKLPLEEVLTEARLLRYADARSWKLGEEYLAAGAVVLMKADTERVTAAIRGTQPYTASLSVTTRGNLLYDCSCPYHQDDGAFCKHLVALGLAYVRRNAVEEVAVPKGSTMDTIQKHLETCTKEQLITLLMAQSLENEPLRRHLLWLAKPTSEPARPRLVFKPARD